MSSSGDYRGPRHAKLRGLLNVPPRGDLLAVIGERFDSTHDVEEFAKAHGIAGTFWNRIGD